MKKNKKNNILIFDDDCSHRCLFPTLLVSLRGLELKKRYQVSLRMVPVDNYRYRYSNMTWSPAGDSDVIQNHERQIFHHPCSPTSGQFWMKRPISFKSVKITHYANSKHGNVKTINFPFIYSSEKFTRFSPLFRFFFIPCTNM